MALYQIGLYLLVWMISDLGLCLILIERPVRKAVQDKFTTFLLLRENLLQKGATLGWAFTCLAIMQGGFSHSMATRQRRYGRKSSAWSSVFFFVIRVCRTLFSPVCTATWFGGGDRVRKKSFKSGWWNVYYPNSAHSELSSKTRLHTVKSEASFRHKKRRNDRNGFSKLFGY